MKIIFVPHFVFDARRLTLPSPIPQHNAFIKWEDLFYCWLHVQPGSGQISLTEEMDTAFSIKEKLQSDAPKSVDILTSPEL
jgi:hypothetical protein